MKKNSIVLLLMMLACACLYGQEPDTLEVLVENIGMYHRHIYSYYGEKIPNTHCLRNNSLWCSHKWIGHRNRLCRIRNNGSFSSLLRRRSEFVCYRQEKQTTSSKHLQPMARKLTSLLRNFSYGIAMCGKILNN